ncbi:MAG: MOSC domain-containing protein [Chloroflexi bacterium]|nr:MOSC domain-containing protein [Chloroflexota bacterium]OJV92640.1 MAG: hypothetical protein BGO39_32735 [Chloroflexi bacterium 54-19]
MAETINIEAIGKVKAVYRYPVKSMRGEEVKAAPLRWVGLAGDRRYSFVRSGSSNRFPWLTAKIFPNLLTYIPYFSEPDNPNESAVRVRTPSGADKSIEDPQLAKELSDLFENPIFLLQVGRGTFDSAPFSIITTQTVNFIAGQTGLPSEVRRFRPNLLVEAFDDKPFIEDSWIGTSILLGQGYFDPATAPRFRLDRTCERCVIVNYNPDTLASNPQVLKFLGKTHQVNAGIYGTIEALGTISKDDVVYRLK